MSWTFGVIAKQAWVSLFFFTSSQIDLLLTIDWSNLSMCLSFLSLLSWELSPSPLQEAVYGFSLASSELPASLSCSWAMIKWNGVTCTQALPWCSHQSDNQDGYQVLYWGIRLTKGWFMSWAGPKRVAQAFVTILRMAHKFIWLIHFWDFPFNIFGPRLTWVTKTTESKIEDKEEGPR